MTLILLARGFWILRVQAPSLAWTDAVFAGSATFFNRRFFDQPLTRIQSVSLSGPIWRRVVSRAELVPDPQPWPSTSRRPFSGLWAHAVAGYSKVRRGAEALRWLAASPERRGDLAACGGCVRSLMIGAYGGEYLTPRNRHHGIAYRRPSSAFALRGQHQIASLPPSDACVSALTRCPGVPIAARGMRRPRSPAVPGCDQDWPPVSGFRPIWAPG